MDVDPRKTALVLIEYQNDFTTEGGSLHDAVKEVMDETGMLENTKRLVDEARRAGATIVHAPISFAPGYGELGDPDKAYGILKGVIDSNSFVKGTWGVEICDDLTPHEGDIVVEGKRGLDTFATTNLDFVLRSREIDTVILAASSPTAASSRRCARRTRRGMTSSRSPTARPRRATRSSASRPRATTRCSRSR